MDDHWYRSTSGDEIIITIRVQPGSKRTQWCLNQNPPKLKVIQKAVEGKANKAVIAILSKVFKVPKSKVKLIKGNHSREKVFSLAPLSKEDFLTVIKELGS